MGGVEVYFHVVYDFQIAYRCKVKKRTINFTWSLSTFVPYIPFLCWCVDTPSLCWSDLQVCYDCKSEEPDDMEKRAQRETKTVNSGHNVLTATTKGSAQT